MKSHLLKLIITYHIILCTIDRRLPPSAPNNQRGHHPPPPPPPR